MSRLELRIGDQEREAAASALGEHFAHGRITREEYDERSAAVWASRTGSELRPVFADLPAPHPPVLASGPWVARTAPVPVATRRRLRPPFLSLVLVVVGIALLTEWWVALLLVGVLWWAFVAVLASRVVRRVGSICRSPGAGHPPWSRPT